MHKVNKNKAAVCIIALSALICFLGASKKGTLESLAVMSVNGKEVSVAEFDYYYYMTAQNLYSYLAQMGFPELESVDLYRPLSQQPIPESLIEQGVIPEDMAPEIGGRRMWADHFSLSARENIEKIYILANEAEKAGMTLNQENRQTLDSIVSDMKSSAQSNGESAESLLHRFLGRGISERGYVEYLERQLVAEQFQGQTKEGYSYSDKELESRYEQNKDDFDYIDFYYHVIPGQLAIEEDPQGDTGELQDSYRKEQKKKAEKMMGKITNAEEFPALVYEYEQSEKSDEDSSGDPDDTVSETKQEALERLKGTTLNTDTVKGLREGLVQLPPEWEQLLSPERKKGDTFILENGPNFFVVLYDRRYRKEETPVDVRHILIGYDEGTDKPSKAEKKAARERADDILNQWKNGAATQESFAELAGTHSADQGSISTGGLYEGITSTSSYVEPFLSWSLGSRKPGDTGIVETEYGFHIMYFVGSGKPVWKTEVSEAMANEAWEKFLSDLMDKAEIDTYDRGMQRTKTPLPVPDPTPVPDDAMSGEHQEIPPE